MYGLGFENHTPRCGYWGPKPYRTEMGQNRTFRNMNDNRTSPFQHVNDLTAVVCTGSLARGPMEEDDLIFRKKLLLVSCHLAGLLFLIPISMAQLAQVCSTSIADALGLPQSCTKSPMKRVCRTVYPCRFCLRRYANVSMSWRHLAST